MKNGVFWDATRVALVRTDVSEELSVSFIRMTRIGEIGITLSFFLLCVLQMLATPKVPSSPIFVTLMIEPTHVSVAPRTPILVTLMMEALCSSETLVLTRTSRHNIPADAILQLLLCLYCC
jgi:hypothetical protein